MRAHGDAGVVRGDYEGEIVSFVRIIAGKFGGRRILVPPSAHPMGEREKGAMFNSLSGDLDGARVLDAFAGSGALGFEALSRGAATAVFVDNARGAAEVIKRNAEELGAEARVYAMSVEKFINFYEKFDIVFADPPYNRPQYKVVERLAGLVARGGLFVLSQAVEDEALALDNFELLSSKVYAGARILVYRLV